ncbi:hypothetical protein EON83_30235 [bacterium]|nr:MAG: hypothetical protein EON83_30235 [bacterium]
MRFLHIALTATLSIAPAQAGPAPLAQKSFPFSVSCLVVPSAPPAALTLESKREWRTVKPELYISPVPRIGAAQWMPMARHQIVPGTNSSYEPMRLINGHVPSRLMPNTAIYRMAYNRTGAIGPKF